MSQQQRSTLQGSYGTSGTEFPDNSTREISEGDMRGFGQNLIDSHFNLIDDALTGATGTKSGLSTITNLRAVVTVGVSLGVYIMFRDTGGSNVLRVYELVSGTDADSSPNVIRPTDYNGSTNTKVWKLAQGSSTVGAGTVTDFSAGNLTPLFTSSVATSTTTPALTFTLSTQGANLVFAGPLLGVDATPTFRALANEDLTGITTLSSLITVGTITSGVWSGTAIGPTKGGTGLTSFTTGDILYASATNVLSKLAAGSNGQVLTLASGIPSWASSSTGTVTSFSAGNLASLFTASVATATSTPALTFTAVSQSANIVFAGPTTGSAAVPTFRSLVDADVTGITTLSALVSVGTITTGVWTGTAVGPTKGGTGLTSYTTGDILYASATNVLSKLAVGSNGQVLTLASGIPSWAAGGTTYTFSTGLTNSSSTITANLSTGISGGQSVIGGTGASENLTLSSTSHSTKGKIIFSSASAYDAVNDWLGLGNTAPLTVLHTSTTLTSSPRGAMFDQYSASTDSSRISLRKARGTFGSPSVITAGDSLGHIFVYGYDGSNFIEGASIQVTNTTVSSGVVSASMIFKTSNTSGTPTTALTIDNAQVLTLANALTVVNGGTGLSTLAQGDIIYGSASNTFSKLAKSTSSTRYLANTGTSNNPAWAQVDLTNGVTGTLPIGNAGTGLTSYTTGDILYASGSSTLSKLAAGAANNRFLQQSGIGTSAVPAWSAYSMPLSVSANSLLYTSSSTVVSELAIGSNGNILTIVSGVPAWSAASGTFWTVASGGTLSAANTITGSSSNTLTYVFAGLGVTAVDGAGAYYQNTTAAAAGVQQMSPSVTFEGRGWATTAGGSSKIVKFRESVLPVQGVSLPTAELDWQVSVDGAAYTNALRLANNGDLTMASGAALTGTGGLSLTSSITSSGTGVNFSNGSVNPGTTNTFSMLNVGYTFSGTAHSVFNALKIQGTINTASDGQMTLINIIPGITAAGGAVTGIDYNPAVTTITGTHLAIRTTSGAALFGATTITASTAFDIRGLSTTTGNTLRLADSGNTVHFTVLDNGSTTITQSAITTGAATEALRVNIGAHTTITAANTRLVYMNLAAGIVQFTGSTGFALQQGMRIDGATYRFASATGTLVDVNTLSIGISDASTNAAITNSHALYVGGGALAGAVTNAYGLTVDTTSGATNNYAAQFINGKTLFAAPASGYASMNLVPGAAVSSPASGDVWHISTSNRLMFRRGSTTAEILSASAVTTEVLVTDTSLTIVYNGTTYKILAKA